MPIEDPFLYSDRWDSAGVDCAFCMYQANYDHWPNTKRDYGCGLHNVPLRVELRDSGYKEREGGSVRTLRIIGKARPKAIEELERIRPLLQDGVLYGCHGQNHFLKEVPFEKLDEYE